MKLTTAPVTNRQTVGQATELANDGSWAKVRIYAAGAREGQRQRTPVELTGTPRELRKFARAIINGLMKDRQ